MVFIEHNNPFHKINILDYTYTCQPSINTALPMRKSILKTIVFVIGCVASVGFLWLITKWSNKYKAILLYSISSLPQATQFLIEQQDLKGGTCIVNRQDRYNIKTQTKAIAFTYHERTYLYNQEKESFYPIRFEQLGIYLDKLRKNTFMPYNELQRKQLQNYYGENAIRLPIQSKLEIFLNQMLTPYEVFQTYGIILWIYEQYYLFSILLLIYSLINYWFSTRQISQNQRKLAEQSYFQTECKVLEKDSDLDEYKQHIIVNMSKINCQFQARSLPCVSKKKNNFQLLCDQLQSPRGEDNTRNLCSQKNITNHFGINIKNISSHQIVPGDLLILQQGDIVPCDCILIKGHILVNQQYTTGQSYPIRKTQLSDFIYSIEKQRSFILNLGTRILKIKNNKKTQKKRIIDAYTENSLEKSMACDNYTQENQIICLVTDTNYNTHRGKYLRAIRYQKKQRETFTVQTIYFIYILLAITTIVYGIIYSRVYHHIHIFSAIQIYLDLLFTCIPPTLPAALSVGISFAQLRLSQYGIHCVVPDCILTGGRVNTIVLSGYRALGKSYQIDSVIVGTNQDRTIGKVYTSFKQYTGQKTKEDQKYVDITKKYLNTKDYARKLNEMFFCALASCHTLQMFEGQLQGQQDEKQLFKFSQSYSLAQDKFQNNKNEIIVGKRIYFKTRDNKMAVTAVIQKDRQIKNNPYKTNIERSFIDQINENSSLQFSKLEGKNISKKVIFMKGHSQAILNICKTETYPKNSFEFIVDMAQKGFLVLAYAYREFSYSENLGTQKQILQTYRMDYIFLGFAILKQKRYIENQDAIQKMKQANLDILLVSQESQLQTNSITILNNIYTKSQLLLCNSNKQKTQTQCKGHIELDFKGQDPVMQLAKQLSNINKKYYFSTTAPLYEQLFIKREAQFHNLFEKFKVFSQMYQKHERNLYNHLEKRQKIAFAVGGGGNLAECANVSLELQRKQSSLLSSFYCKEQSLMSVVNCLRVCRAGLSTNFHCFSMMILFSLVQFTTESILQYYFQVFTYGQQLYLDLFVTFPIFITLNMTLPSKKLSKQIPQGSFFSARALSTTIGQALIQLIAQLFFINYLLQFQLLQIEKNNSFINFQNGKGYMDQTVTSTCIFVMSNYLYLGIVLSTSVSKPFRKPFYTNPYYTINLVFLWIYNTLIVIYPQFVPNSLRTQNTTPQEELIISMALIFGNLVMILMYLYQNILVWIWQLVESRQQNKKQQIIVAKAP